MGRHENAAQIPTRDRSYQRRQVEAADRGARARLDKFDEEAASARRPRALPPRPVLLPSVGSTSSPAPDEARRMPGGVCHGCLDDGPLPPFGDGYCFLCATDGPPGDRSTTGSALPEGVQAPDPTAG